MRIYWKKNIESAHANCDNVNRSVHWNSVDVAVGFTFMGTSVALYEEHFLFGNLTIIQNVLWYNQPDVKLIDDFYGTTLSHKVFKKKTERSFQKCSPYHQTKKSLVSVTNVAVSLSQIISILTVSFRWKMCYLFKFLQTALLWGKEFCHEKLFTKRISVYYFRTLCV